MKGVIFCGLQASGKSTFYQANFSKTHIRLSMDMLKTRHREKILLQACLLAKQPVVIDNTNPTQSDRCRYIEEFKKHHFEIVGYYFSSKLDECLQYNKSRQGKECIPEAGIRGTYNKLELPALSEGFDALYYVTRNNGSFTVEEWQYEI
ncbi:AAA family ATPase [Hahella ganghwensis]|uniref:AAA family ATPase n=1 Tax=Hahella ganghwensis TaxID=286420 RepID=UPI000367FE00|nr:AAA family ATPase [Hahella ganghwensis]